MVRHLAIIALVASAASAGACARQEPAAARTPAADILLRAETAVFEARVPRNGTLDSILRNHALSGELVNAVVRSARSVFNPRQLRADRPYRLVLSFDGFLREFEYEIDADRFLRIISREHGNPEALEAEVLPIEKDSTVVAIRGDIDARHPSLIAAMGETGENIQLAMALADVFAGQIDFNSDLQPGDGFEVLFEKSTRDGQFAGYGAILGATFVADGKRHEAYRWVHPETQKAAYYDEEGRSLKRFFLVSPLKFEPRITSHFSRSRLHPVLNFVRAHTGVDYGAPHGASVVAVAAGTVVSAGRSGGAGNQVRIRHAGGVETYYMHLSAFGPGIRAGVHVDQGQLIGRVGSTGTATGPHLHFSLRRGNAFVDPVAERRRQPPGEPRPAAHLAAYRTARQDMLDQIGGAMLADAPRQRPDAIAAAAVE
jgi:murein DD-endopeptidase MepM/ murein hydrolase activator NlpD